MLEKHPDLNHTAKDLNFEILSRHELRILDNRVVVDVFRGSAARRNRKKVGELTFSFSEINEAMEKDNLQYVVMCKDGELNIPLVPDESVW